MAVINRHAIVAYSPGQMFDLVNDVATYPEFLPWCSSSKVISTSEDEVHAALNLSVGGLQKSFTTCNRLQKDKMIEIRLVDGPFKHLEGFWRFDEVEGKGSKISLDMEFEFAGMLLDMAIGPIFFQMANSLVDAFCKRAETVYGKGEAIAS